MAYTYPPAAPQLSGDALTISRFLANPALVARRIRSLAEQRFISDVLLSGRLTIAGGAVAYETSEGIYTERPVESVAPGAEYPLTGIGTGVAQLARVEKWGQDTIVTDEAISRQLMNPVERAFAKLVNSVVRQVDTISLSLIASAVTQTIAAAAPWNGSGVPPSILRDVMRAQATMLGLNQGFAPDTLAVDDLTFAYLASDDKVATALSRENAANPIYSGAFPVIAGLRVLPTANLPGAGAWVVDSTQLGGMADEVIQSPGYVSTDGLGVEGKTIREDLEDRWRLRARRPTVPVVLEPGAAVRITGV